jgi:SAM-dependent methyltransferase
MSVKKPLSQKSNEAKDMVDALVKAGPLKILKSRLYCLDYLLKGIDLGMDADVGIDPTQGNRHDASGKADLSDAFVKLGLRRKVHSVMDIGCGKGGALIAFHGLGVERLVGIELSQKMHQICIANLRKSKICADVRQTNAVQVTEFADIDLVYLFNPLPVPALREFLENLIRFVQKSRQTTLILFRYFPASGVAVAEPLLRDERLTVLQTVDLNARYVLLKVIEQPTVTVPLNSCALARRVSSDIAVPLRS